MKKNSYTFILLFILRTVYAGGQSEAVLSYIDHYKWIAIEQMHAYNIPASITLAQGILESGAGMSELAEKSNNHFGIKCHDNWKGDKVYYDDDAEDECFRKYKKVEDSYADHSEFLTNSNRYQKLFELKITDYKGWAKGLKSAGYATNPKYAELLIDIIEKYELYDYDAMTTAELKKDKPKKKEYKEDKNNDIAETGDQHFNWSGYKEHVFYFNRIPAVTIKENDSPAKLAQEHQTKVSNLLKYNDLTANDSLQPGTNFYLQPKRKKGKEKFHVVREKETMWSISRDEGILMEALYEKNKMQPRQEPAIGETLYLRKTRKGDIKLDITKNNEQASKNIGEINFDNKFVLMDEEIIIDEAVPVGVETKKEEVKKNAPPVIINKTEEDQTKNVIVEKKTTPIYHNVQAKETLYALSKKYETTIEEIKEWNSLENNEIKIGQKIIVGYK